MCVCLAQGYIVLGQRLVFTEAELAARTGFGWQLVSLTTSFVGIIVSVWFRRAGRLTMRSKGLPKGKNRGGGQGGHTTLTHSPPQVRRRSRHCGLQRRLQHT